MTDDQNRQIAELLFGDVTLAPEELELKYPPRALPEGAAVTRIAPSPTGNFHLGNLYSVFIDERLAHQNGGVLYLRIEDTDQKREVPGAADLTIRICDKYGINFDEGFTIEGERGKYGPYRQKMRAGTYKVYIKKLLSEEKAYPCFCTKEESEEIKKEQTAAGELTGYYGKWARCRELGFDEVKANIEAGKRFIIRFRSEGSEKRQIIVDDMIKGRLEIPENVRDEVIFKSDGLPTYHFAHVVDDHLMRTTHVVRGEEWLATLPIHIQFFGALGWRPPKYLHTAQLLKKEGESKKKLSKRDAGFGMEYYDKAGFIPEAVIEYLMTVLNSNYEAWRTANPSADYKDFPFSVKKLSPSGAVFDTDKLMDVSKNVVALMPAGKIYAAALEWTARYDKELNSLLARDEGYALSILSIGRGVPKPRKDIGVLADLRGYMSYFYDELFEPDYTFPENISREDAAAILRDYAPLYDAGDESDAWFGKIRAVAERFGYAPEVKLYKSDPAAYKGHVGDVSAVIRVAVCGRQSTPDMREVMRILGADKVRERIERYLNKDVH